jgi:hypothetical protein
MATNSGWTTSTPSGTSSIALGDDEIRSFKSYVEKWFEDEHYLTDGSTNSAGEHKLGSARVYMATSASHLSSPENGRLLHLSTSNALYVGSSSSWSIIAGVNEASRNTFTAQQNFHANAKIGVSGSAISQVVGYAVALSVYTLAGSAATSFQVTNAPDSALSNSPLMMSLALPTNARVVHSAYYDADASLIIANISNQSTVQVVIPAQTVRVIGVQLA